MSDPHYTDPAIFHDKKLEIPRFYTKKWKFREKNAGEVNSAISTGKNRKFRDFNQQKSEIPREEMQILRFFPRFRDRGIPRGLLNLTKDAVIPITSGKSTFL